VLTIILYTTREKMQYVTIYTDDHAVGLGKIDNKGRLIWRSGVWVPVPYSQPELRDKLLRKGVKRIVKDGGKKYKQFLKGLGLPPTYIPPD